MDNNTIVCNLFSVWDILADIREAVGSVMSGANPHEIDFAKIAASELCENAIKYGVQHSTDENMKFFFSYNDNIVRIEVTNSISEKIHEENLKSFINMINQSGSTGLYVKRLHDLLNSRDVIVSQLGLFRVADICKYKISCEFSRNVAKIIAVREIGAGNGE